MNIGKPLREIIIEPVPDSLPEREHDPAPAPAETPAPDREPVPA